MSLPSRVSLFLALLLLPGFRGDLRAQPLADSMAVQFFPTEQLFPRLLADGTTHQLGIAKDLHSRRWLGSIGALRPVFQFSLGTVVLQAGIGATVQTSILRKSPHLQVVTVDFFVDVPVDIRLSRVLTLRTGYGHYSAHLADDGIELFGRSSINYAKDYIRLLSAYALPVLGGFVYGGGRMDFHTLPETQKHWVAQFGGEVGNITILPNVNLYGAFDCRLKEEAAWRSTQSYQLGVKLFERPAGRARIAYTLRRGIDDRGQFYTSETDLSLFGVFVDF